MVKTVLSAAKVAFGGFIALHRPNPNQTEFLDLIIDSLTEGGIVEPTTFYESPFTDFDEQGIAGVFDQEQRRSIVTIVNQLNGAATA